MKRKKSKITVFAVFTTVAILVWIFTEAYSRLNKRELVSIPPQVIAPITPSLDTEVLGNMEKRLWFSESEFSGPPPVVPEEIKAEASPSSEASPSGGGQN